MYFVVISMIVGVVIGSFTNAIAIKMLFRPFHPWKLGGLQVPFTPGVIPKRRDEIADKLGHMVERYLFTSDGLKEFIERAGLKDELFQRFMAKIEGWKREDQTVGTLAEQAFGDNWNYHAYDWITKQSVNVIHSQAVREQTLEELLDQRVIEKIEQKSIDLADAFTTELIAYLHTEQGSIWIEQLITHLLEGKKMLGFLAGTLFEGGQIQEKIVSYLEKLLKQPEMKVMFSEFISKEWNNLSKKPIGNLLDEIEEFVEASSLTTKMVDSIGDTSVAKIIQDFEDQQVLERAYNRLYRFVEKRIDKLFAYLSVSKVVKEEVKRFSFEQLEKMIIDVASKELKMITYFGGILGGLLGLVQGTLLLLFS